jgi:hypothetical protein
MKHQNTASRAERIRQAPNSPTKRSGNVGPTVITAGTSFYGVRHQGLCLPIGTRVISGYDGTEQILGGDSPEKLKE